LAPRRSATTSADPHPSPIPLNAGYSSIGSYSASSVKLAEAGELIPGPRATCKGGKIEDTFGPMIGFVILMVLDTTGLQ
jgi:hypothetical protein